MKEWPQEYWQMIEASGIPPPDQELTQPQEENLAYWDKFIDDIGVQLMVDREAYRIYNPRDIKNSLG